MKQHFLLDPHITFLNFGSFGACPKVIMQRYQELQIECEANPVHFITKSGQDYLHESKKALAEFVHVDPMDLIMVTNPTYAVNLVAKNMNLQEGDEILSTHIEYGACDKTWEFYCAQAKACYVRQPITLPIQSEEQFVEEFFRGYSAKTKLIFMSHITSSTALIFPVEKIIAKAKTLGVPVFIDGAHVPGHIPLDLEQLGCDYYTGACHKWMMTPKGCTFFWAKRERQPDLNPLIVSWGYKSMFPGPSLFQDYHQMNGTRDITPFLLIRESLAFMKEHDWASKSKDCRELVYANAARFAALLGTLPLAAVLTQFIGQMLSLPIDTEEPEKLKNELYERFRIEIPVMRQGDKNYIRFSIQVFNSQEDLDVLHEALLVLLEEGKWKQGRLVKA